jgi:mRNA interferase RelE/StbE
LEKYEIFIKPSARKELRRVGTKRDRQKIVAAIQGLAGEPRPIGSQKLVGTDHCFRIRAGDYRIIYEIADVVVSVIVIRVAHRKDAYRS